MKRIFAPVLLAAFVAGPSLKWLCEHTCGAEHSVAAAEDCHRSSEPAQLAADGQDCGNGDSPVALITKRVQPESQSLVSPRGPSASIVVTLTVFARVTDFTLTYSTPPPSGFLVPLRL